MATFRAGSRMSGKLTVKKIGLSKAPLSWRLKQYTRPDFLLGHIGNFLAHGLTRLTGINVMIGSLRIVKIDKDGRRIDYGLLLRGSGLRQGGERR